MKLDPGRYRAEYFLPTLRKVLDPLLREHGFEYAGHHRGVTAYWVSDHRFFRVGYMPETTPKYELLIGVGISESSPIEPKSSRDSVGVWRLLPPETAPQIADWEFRSPETLEQALLAAWTEAVLPFVVPLWSDDDRLAEVIAEYNDELTREDDRLMEDRLRRYARTEFDAGRFAEATAAYEALDEAALTSSDRKRMAIARRHL